MVLPNPILIREYKQLMKEPLEGFIININEMDSLVWKVGIFGPPGTPYEGGYFKAEINFPTNYPYSPPKMAFTTKVWHPNVYENGEICISILHEPRPDPHSDELPCERWNPTQNVRTILLSVVSLLNEPNTSSPANIEASKMYRSYINTNGKVDDYIRIIKMFRQQVEISREAAHAEGVNIPKTLEEYLVKSEPESQPDLAHMSDIDDIYYDDYDDEEKDDESCTIAP